jgi:hypothetical protein
VLRVRASDDGAPREGEPVETADRVGALGGSVTAGAHELEVRLPCA